MESNCTTLLHQQHYCYADQVNLFGAQVRRVQELGIFGQIIMSGLTIIFGRCKILLLMSAIYYKVDIIYIYTLLICMRTNLLRTLHAHTYTLMPTFNINYTLHSSCCLALLIYLYGNTNIYIILSWHCTNILNPSANIPPCS
jgi:hypothetical protein